MIFQKKAPQLRRFLHFFGGFCVNPGAAVCLSCGAALNNTANKLNGQDKIAMGVLALFLGGLGIHNFMMGETKKGIFKIATSLCFGIGAIFL